jgi:hypothetical protein
VWPEKDLAMTRARTLKTTIRARMAKTGERYTTARRHVLASPPAPRTASAVRAAAPPPAPPVATRSRAPSAESRGGISEAKVLERTGHDLAHWFEVLDDFGLVKHGHTASARYLHEAFGIDGWYCQGITVAYERARGLRAVNQRLDGRYEVSVTKMLDRDVDEVRDLMAATRRTTAWTRELDRSLVAALVAGVSGPGAKGFVSGSMAAYHCRFRWDGLPVEIMVIPQPANRAQVVVVNRKLPSAEVKEARRAAWRTALAAFAASVTPAGTASKPRKRAS